MNPENRQPPEPLSQPEYTDGPVSEEDKYGQQNEFENQDDRLAKAIRDLQQGLDPSARFETQLMLEGLLSRLEQARILPLVENPNPHDPSQNMDEHDQRSATERDEQRTDRSQREGYVRINQPLPVFHQLDSLQENPQGQSLLPPKRRRILYGDPDWFDHLPPDLEHLRVLKDSGLPFAHYAFGVWSLSYEIRVEDDSNIDSKVLDTNQSKDEYGKD